MTFNELLELDKQAAGKERKRRTKERPSARAKGRKSEPKPESIKQGTWGRPLKARRERRTERRPYDFFKDQLLWLNKTKVEIEERYERRVTANAMVQLALDLFIKDYRRRGERSKLITHLVAEQWTSGGPHRGAR